jgi:hypothetical protein
MPTITPYEPGSSAVVDYVDDRCDRITSAKGPIGARTAYIAAIKGLPTLDYRDAEEFNMAATALNYAANNAGVEWGVLCDWDHWCRARFAR